MSLLASGYRSILPQWWSHLHPSLSPHHQPWCIPHPSSWDQGTTGIMGPILGTGGMDIVMGTGGLIRTTAGIVDTAGNAEGLCSAGVSREDVERGTPERHALIHRTPFALCLSLSHGRHHTQEAVLSP
jgi:hypothetical protein